MTNEQIKAIQAKIGTEPDGFWGEKSISACKSYLRRLMDSCDDSLYIPRTDQNSLTAAYGLAGDESELVNLDVHGCGVRYEGQPVKTIRVNKARGAAIDLMAATNRNKQHYPSSADMPFSVIEVFAKHGWLSLGAFISRDAMHFQRTK